MVKKPKNILLFTILLFRQVSYPASLPPEVTEWQESDSSGFFSPSTVFNQKRFNTVIATESALYASSLIGLNELWYKNYPRSGFHFFNDNGEWLQMDKTGHIVTSYYAGRIGLNLMQWSGIEHRKAAWYGGLAGSLYQTTIEILDGFSSQWGFSAGDFAANTLGSALLVGQELAWKEQRVVLKFSFSRSSYAQYRPEVLGKNYAEQLLKDYNGQTYWASINLSSFMNEGTKFPQWLSIACGYGSEGMTGAYSNPPVDSRGNPIPAFERYRQFYFSLDADLTRIKTRSKFLKALFTTLGFIKIPFPAMEINKRGMKFNSLMF